MPIPDDLRDVLVCPKCKGELEYPADRDEVRCPACHLVYGVVGELPVMLVDEAKSDDALNPR